MEKYLFGQPRIPSRVVQLRDDDRVEVDTSCCSVEKILSLRQVPFKNPNEVVFGHGLVPEVSPEQ